MTYICPKCQVSLTDRDYLEIPCIVDEKENPFGSCPVCGQDSNMITEWERQEGDFKAYSFEPMTPMQCTNSCCVDCIFQKEDPNNTHGNCNHQNRLNGVSHQANLFNF